MRLTEQLLALARADPLIHFQGCVQIEGRDKTLRRPVANIFQQRMCAAYSTLLALALELGIQIRILGLKIRQCGGTTIGCELTYHHSQRFATDSVIIANVRDNAAEMLRKIQLLHQTDAIEWGNPLVPTKAKLEWANGSRVEITSAETMNMGISRTRQFGLFSEAAKYPRGGVKDDKRIMASALPSIGGPGTIGIAETTPEGASGWFYEQWQGALPLDEFLAQLAAGNPSPGNGWVQVFAAWHEFPENRKVVSEVQAKQIMAKLSPRERLGVDRYGWDAGQIAWRRATIASECGGSEDLFDEYYPEDPESCFLSSGRPRFDMRALVELESRAMGQVWQAGTIDLQSSGAALFSPSGAMGHGPIVMREPPREGFRYIVWCDPATGEDQTESDDPDRHSIGVLRVGYTQDGTEMPDAVVARVAAPYYGEADDTANLIEGLSKLYGDALVVLEVNMGLHILEHLKLRGVPLYKREIIDPHDRENTRYMWGWKLKDRDQRRTVIDSLAIAIRDRAIDPGDPHLISEMKTFIISKNGKEEARGGCHDDDVMGLAMAYYCRGAATLYTGNTRRRKAPRDGWKKWT